MNYKISLEDDTLKEYEWLSMEKNVPYAHGCKVCLSHQRPYYVRRHRVEYIEE